MKRMEITIRPENLETVKEILAKSGCSGMTLFSAMGAGNQKGDASEVTIFQGGEFRINLLPKIHIVVYVKAAAVEEVLRQIHERLSSGRVGDGKVAVSDLDTVMRIRTGERGEKAL